MYLRTKREFRHRVNNLARGVNQIYDLKYQFRVTKSHDKFTMISDSLLGN